MSLSAWAYAHLQGFCGGDAAGCPRCVAIAAMDLPYTDQRRQALGARRNKPHGLTSVMVTDPGD
jgi:hypothetical protein